MSTPQQVEVSYIVSLYGRTDDLRVCLAMLHRQTHQDFEVIVTDNSTNRHHVRENRNVVRQYGDRFKYIHSAPKIQVSDCYWSSEYGVKFARGRWLAFPCEDVYLPPEWTQRMLGAAVARNLDLVLCANSVTGPDTCGIDGYEPLKLGTLAFPGYKPSFLIKRSKFTGWVNKPLVGACSGVDKTTLQYLMRDPKIRWGVCEKLYYVHN